MKNSCMLWMLVGAFFSTVGGNAEACQVTYPQADGTLLLSDIRIVPAGDNFNQTTGAALNTAIARWNSVCGGGVPDLSKTAPSAVTFTVSYEKGNFDLTTDPEACAATLRPQPGEELREGTIFVFERTRSGTDCTAIFIEATLHEIGHRLGLDHSPCSSNIMVESGLPADLAGLSPRAADCAVVDPFWLTPDEVVLLPPTCDCSYDSDCEGVMGPPPEGGTWLCRFCRCIPSESPLVIHLPDYVSPRGGGGRAWWKEGFCGAEAPTVCLDWRGHGQSTCTTWTGPGSEIAFVVALNDADHASLSAEQAIPAQPWRHFFGNVTMSPEGDFPFANGFDALAAFCGLERFSAIDPAECGPALSVWADRNSDGLMVAEELLEFDELGIQALGEVEASPRHDLCGNAYPVEAEVSCAGRPGPCGLWLDIFFFPREVRWWRPIDQLASH